jgi:hypothetical protein
VNVQFYAGERVLPKNTKVKITGEMGSNYLASISQREDETIVLLSKSAVLRLPPESWFYIRTANGTKGWVKANAITENH